MFPYKGELWRALGGESQRTFPIPPNGNLLKVAMSVRSTAAATSDPINILINGAVSASYDWQRSYVQGANGVITNQEQLGKNGYGVAAAIGDFAGASTNSGTAGYFEFELFDISNPGMFKEGRYSCRQPQSNATAAAYWIHGGIQFQGLAPISSFAVACQNGAFAVNSSICYWVF